MKKLDESALVVLSGGQDSTICLGWALETFKEVSCVTFDYGQRHSIELDAAKAVVAHFAWNRGIEISHEIIKIGDGILESTSPLTSSSDLEQYADHRSMVEEVGDRIEATFVPMRNSLFLTLAANRAVARGAKVIVTGVCAQDSANYPDCRQEFLISQAATINAALGFGHSDKNQILLMAPVILITKAEALEQALLIRDTYAALAYSHTAYDGEYPPMGRDHASILRAHSFEQAALPDPLVLRANSEGLMDLPDTPNYSPECISRVADLLPFAFEVVN